MEILFITIEIKILKNLKENNNGDSVHVTRIFFFIAIEIKTFKKLNELKFIFLKKGMCSIMNLLLEGINVNIKYWTGLCVIKLI